MARAVPVGYTGISADIDTSACDFAFDDVYKPPVYIASVVSTAPYSSFQAKLMSPLLSQRTHSGFRIFLRHPSPIFRPHSSNRSAYSGWAISWIGAVGSGTGSTLPGGVSIRCDSFVYLIITCLTSSCCCVQEKRVGNISTGLCRPSSSTSIRDPAGTVQCHAILLAGSPLARSGLLMVCLSSTRPHDTVSGCVRALHFL